MIKIGLAATNDAAGLDNKNVSAFIELAQKNDCEVIKGESAFFEPEEAKRVANGLKDCDLIVVTVKGFTWFGECINEFTKLGVPVCCLAVPEPKKEGVLLFNSMTGLNLFTSVANSGREIPAVKWLYGNADDTLFVNRFLTTVGAIRCLKAIKGKKIAIAGGVAEGFVNLEYDKKKVESRFGITIEETDIDKIIDAVLEMKDEEIAELAEEIKSSASSFTADEERFVKSCKLICVLKRYFEEERHSHNFLITHENTNNSKDLVFPFTDDQEFAVLQYIVPMQVLARKLSLDLGIDCNIPSDPQFHFKMNSYLKEG